jgi:hydroxymethylpyrimidine pyrophosphatase-like HAD family hydrolase
VPDHVTLLTEDADAVDALSRVRVLYTDLDGTLVARGGSVLADARGAPSTVVAEAIVETNRARLDVVPVSGRSRLQMRELTQLLGWNAYIAEAGAITVHGTGLDADICFDRGVWTGADVPDGDSPFEAIERAGAYDALVDAFPGHIEHYAPWQLEREATLLLRGCLDVPAAQQTLDRLPLPLDLIDNGMVRSYGTLACRDMPPHAYHVVPKGVSKARAITLDLASRGLCRDQAAAIGDSAADLGMADAVSVMALVANAFESHGVLAELERNHRSNVWRLAGERGEGWAEFARAWTAAAAT